MPATFDNLGISFQYPDNWQLDEEDIRAGQSAVTVFSPGGAFWSVAMHTKSAAEPMQMAEAALEAMRKEYDELDAEPVRNDRRLRPGGLRPEFLLSRFNQYRLYPEPPRRPNDIHHLLSGRGQRIR